MSPRCIDHRARLDVSGQSLSLDPVDRALGASPGGIPPLTPHPSPEPMLNAEPRTQEKTDLPFTHKFTAEVESEPAFAASARA